MNAQIKKVQDDEFKMPSLGVDANENLKKLVAFFKINCPFKFNKNWSWDSKSWNVTDNCKITATRANYKQRLHFTRHNQLDRKVKTATEEMLPFFSSQLANIAKCHISYSQAQKKKSTGTLQNLINAYRYLDLAISKSDKSADMITTTDFRKAELIASKHLSNSTFYKTAGLLESIQAYLIVNKLTKHKPTFKKVSVRSEQNLPSDTRIDQKSIDDRSNKLPTMKALATIAELSRMNLQGRDALLQSLTEILFATGLRFGEVITLDVDCLQIYRKNIQCEITGRIRSVRVTEIKYIPEKGGLILAKEIAKESLSKILIKAIKRVKKQLKDLREEIKLASEHQFDYFPTLPLDSRVFVPEAVKLTGWSSSSNLISYLRKNLGLELDCERNPKTGIKSKVIDTKRLKLSASNKAIANINALSNVLSKISFAKGPASLLFVQKHQENHAKKRETSWNYQLLTHGEYSDFLSGRNGYNILDVFQRVMNIELNDKDALTSHKFRHFLNTIAQLADSISDIEIARYFGRRYIGDNEAYDHTSSVKRVFDHSSDILNSDPINADRAKEAFVMFPLVERDEVLDTIDGLATTMATAVGVCRHDFSESPCGRHYACLRGCSEYQRTKGNKQEIAEINAILEQHEKHLAEAKLAVESEYYGSNNWLRSHQELVDGCRLALAIEDNVDIKQGDRVSVFPTGKVGCEAA